jgi:hypothetical protein
MWKEKDLVCNSNFVTNEKSGQCIKLSECNYAKSALVSQASASAKKMVVEDSASGEIEIQSIQVPQEITCPNTSDVQDDSSSVTINLKSSNEDQRNQALMVLPSKRIRRQPEKLKKDFLR